MEYPKRIEHLLDKYWQAETSVEEENELKSYFAVHPEAGGATAGYFHFLDKEVRTNIPPVEETGVQAQVRPMWKQYLAIAAGIVLICVAVFSLNNIANNDAIETQHANVHEIQDPDEAYREAKQALLLIASKMQESQEKAAKEIEKVKPYTEIIK